MENETVWLSQAQMSLLFQKDQSVIARHINNVFNEGELDRSSNMQILHITISKYKPTALYSLDVIISVGYRVKSRNGTLFRNGILYAPDGRKRIADNTLAALTLMIAESRPEEKDVMVKVVVNLINQKN